MTATVTLIIKNSCNLFLSSLQHALEMADTLINSKLLNKLKPQQLYLALLQEYSLTTIYVPNIKLLNHNNLFIREEARVKTLES